MAIIQRQPKMKMKEVEGMPLNHIMNFGNVFKKFRRMFSKDLIHHTKYGYQNPEVIRSLGRPNVTMVGYESSPGVWVFDDEETEIVLVIFSDCHRKNPWKGTSVELCVPDDIEEQDFIEFYKRFKNKFSVLGA